MTRSFVYIVLFSLCLSLTASCSAGDEPADGLAQNSGQLNATETPTTAPSDEGDDPSEEGMGYYHENPKINSNGSWTDCATTASGAKYCCKFGADGHSKGCYPVM